MEDIEEFYQTYHGEYFAIALDHYATIQQLKKEQDEIQERYQDEQRLTDEYIDLVADKNDAIGRHALEVLILSALSLEAFINHYAIERLGKTYFKNHLDRLDLLSKWVVIPRIVTRKQLKPGSQTMQNLKWLITLRNKLVHYKSRQVHIDNLDALLLLWESDAEKAIATVRETVLGLKEIDPTIETDWMEE